MKTIKDWNLVCSVAETLIKSKLLPATIRTKEAAIAIILKGQELGIGPMQSFSSIHIMNGKPTISAELMLGLLAQGGVTWTWIEDGSDGQAIVEFSREGFKEPARGTFSLEDAKQAGVLANPTWKKYPANMLRARAVSNGARMIAPDLLSGAIYTPEELGATVDEEGDVVEPSAHERFLAYAANALATLGEEDYNKALDRAGIENVGQVESTDVDTMRRVGEALKTAMNKPLTAVIDAIDGEVIA